MRTILQDKLDPKIRFGIIGCSRIAKRSTIPAIIKSEFAEIGIIGSRSLDKAKTFSNEFNSKKFGTYEDVISDDSIDAVYISTPIGTHEEWAIKAASAGVAIPPAAKLTTGRRPRCLTCCKSSKGAPNFFALAASSSSDAF